jgi:glycosyltransferase involved in cell wall biosynthesis
MKLLLVEPAATGHHLALYTRLIARAAVGRGWSVSVLTSASATTHASLALVRGEVPGDFEVFTMADVPNPATSSAAALLRFQFAHYRALRTAFRTQCAVHGFDMVYVVTLDHFDKAMSVLGSPFGSHRFGGMMLNPKFHRQAMAVGPATRSDVLYRWLFLRLLRIPRLSAVTVVDETFDAFVRRSDDVEEYRKVKGVPEVGQLIPGAPRAAARASLGIQPHEFVVVVYGSLTLRKGVRELLQALRERPLANVTVLLAGQQSAEVEDLMREAGAMPECRIIQRIGFQDSASEALIFAAGDAVWLGYASDFFGSSGVFFLAASAGLPVLASKHGVIGWLTRKHDTGILIDPDDSAAVADAILAIASDDGRRARYRENALRLTSAHTAEAFGNAVCDAVGIQRSDAGMAASESR